MIKSFFFKHRNEIYIVLLGIILMSYLVSYAILSISTFLFLVFFFIDRKQNLKLKWTKIKSNKIILFYAIYFICQCIGLIYSSNLDYGLRRVNTSLPILFLPAIIYAEKFNKDLFNKLLRLLRLYVILFFLLFLIIHVFIDGRSINVFGLYLLTEKLGISQFYIVFILLIPLLYTLNDLLEKKNILLNSFFLTIILLLILLLSNKTAVLMLLIIFIIKIINHFKGRNTFFKLSVLFLITMLLASITYNITGVRNKFEIMFKSTDFDIEIIKTKNKVTFTKNTLEHRLLINYISIREISKNLPFGVGTGDYQDVLNQKYKEVHFKLGIQQKFNNHNQYISEALKTGILGFFVFIILLVYLFKAAIYKNQYYFIVLLLFSIGCFFESYLDRQHGVIIFSFIIPLLYVYENQIDQLKTHEGL